MKDNEDEDSKQPTFWTQNGKRRKPIELVVSCIRN